ncbi:MAG: hypothetical protein HON16_02280 [Euryarchaeota archaeon]|nr:hypothetical protein [Euryarchaeota archaeon]
MYKSNMTPVIIAIMLSIVILPVSGQSNSPEITVNDGRLTSINLESGETYSDSWLIKENEWYSVQMDCQSCTGTVKFNGTEIDSSSSSLNGMVSSDGIIELNIESSISEEVGLSIIQYVKESFDSSRPAPNQPVQTISGVICYDINECINNSRGNLASIPDGEFTNQSFITGVIESGQSEYFAIDVSKGDTLELSLAHSTSDIYVEVYFQNQTDEILLPNSISSPSKLSVNQAVAPHYWHFDGDGRAVIKVESQSLNTLWALQSTIYESQEMTVLPDNSYLEVYGHNRNTVVLDVSEAKRLSLKSPYSETEISTYQLMNGNWVESNSFTSTSNVATNLYVYPNVSAVKMDFSADVFFVQITVEDYSDMGQGIEAPSLAPIYKETDNSSWPIIDLENETHEGQLTIPISDYSDVYKIEITGWEDSIHFVKFTIEGDITDCEVELIEKNQETWEDKDTKVRTISSGDIQVALELERGTHFLRISIINSSAYNNSWGEDVESKFYTITSQYELVDEGEEPWFPPDENAEKWGSIARWFMGGLFLIPAIIAVLMYRKNYQFANSLSNKKKRLEWLKKKLDDGTSTPKESRRFLRSALDSITTLEWEPACDIWGEYDVEHRTEGVAIVAWKLDDRLSKDGKSWPIIVGVNIIEGNWEMAALRLDAPQGEPWNITHVHPRFLSRGEEIFLDSMVTGNIVFLTIEIEGSSSCVDIELNGRVDGKPFASRIPSTLWRTVDSEE